MLDYFKDPLKYAQAMLAEGDKFYEQHKPDIDTAKKHYLLGSDHLDIRKNIPGRFAHYLPEIHPSIRKRAASVWDTLRSGEPAIKLTATDPDIPGVVDAVARLENYVNDVFEAGDLWEQVYWWAINAEMFPYGAAYGSWQDKWGQVPQVNPMTGRIDYQELIVYSGPQLFALQPEDYRGDFYARNVAEMKYHFMIKDVSEGYIRQRVKAGLYNQPFNATAFKDAATTSEYAKKRQTQRFNDGYQRPDSYGYELIIGFMSVLDEERESEVVRLCTYCGDYLLDEKEWPYIGIAPPFELVCSEGLPGEVAGMSTAMLGEANQNMTNELWNSALEADEYDIGSPMWFKGSVMSQPIWEWKAMWKVSDDFEAAPFVKPNPSRSIMDKMQMLRERNQELVAAYDTIQPVTEGSKQTLGEYLSKKKDHSVVQGVNYQFYANAISRMTKRFIAMARENLPDWIELKMFGPNAILNSLTVADLAADVVVEIPKVRAMANEEMQMVKWDRIMANPAIMQNPLIQMNPMLMWEHLNRFYESQGEKNIEELIGPKPGGIYGGQIPPQIAAQAQAGAGGPGLPAPAY